jgi:hypothetical protein
MLKRNCSIALGTFILFVSLCFGAVSAQAASACKGSAKAACEGNSNCSWVNGYTRKDGAKVAPHCKSKPKKSSGSASKAKKTDSKK